MAVARKKKVGPSIYVKKVLVVLVFLLPIIVLSFIFGSAFSYLGTLNNYYTHEIEVDSDEFMEVDPIRLASAAENWSLINYLYCFPQNLTGDGWDYYPFTSSRYRRNPSSYGIYNESDLLKSCDIFDVDEALTEISTFVDTGHATAYCGLTLIGEVLKYAVNYREGETAEAQAIESNIYRLVKAFSLLSEIDPEGRMARYVIPDTAKAKSEFIWFPYDEEYSGTHLKYNYTYIGPNGKEYTYWLETGTSVDLYICVFAGLGITYRFVNNATIRSKIRTTVDRMLTYFENTGWKFIDFDGKTHLMGSEAVNTKPISDTSYCLAFLLVGKTVHPERWASTYNYYAYDRLYAKKVGKQSQLGFHAMFSWAEGYFNIDLMMSIAGCLTILETDPQLEVYYKSYLNKIYDIVKYHRNAWFDAFYALGMADIRFDNYDDTIKPPQTTLDDSVYSYIAADIGDCLMRCSYKKKTGRRFHNPISNASYEEYNYLSPIPGAKYPDVQPYNWEATINLENPVINLISALYNPDIAWTHSVEIWDRPIPADWRRSTTFMWEYSPFDTINTASMTGIEQEPNGDYTTPYWIARYLNLTGFAL